MALPRSKGCRTGARWRFQTGLVPAEAEDRRRERGMALAGLRDW
ncbi:hypothetical protein [Streptomyces sp. SAJ15]|nr:hypothetical protein [Streptomyces sp. SAJ15]